MSGRPRSRNRDDRGESRRDRSSQDDDEAEEGELDPSKGYTEPRQRQEQRGSDRHRHGERHGSERHRDGRDRDARDSRTRPSSHAREPGEREQRSSRESQHRSSQQQRSPSRRGGEQRGNGGQQAQRTPPKVSSNPILATLLEETHRRAQRDAQQRRKRSRSRSPSLERSPGGEQPPQQRKRRHSPIVYEPRKRHEGGGAAEQEESRGGRWTLNDSDDVDEQERPGSRQANESIQDRAMREAAEYRRHLAEQEAAAAEADAPLMKRSPSFSGSEEEHDERLGLRQPDEDVTQEGGAADAVAGVKKSRWLDAGEEQEGPPPGAALPPTDEQHDLEELNRRERAELEAGVLDSEAEQLGSDMPENTPQQRGGDMSPLGNGAQHEELPEVNMLQACRSVDEYEKLNRISEGTYGVVFRAREKKTARIYALKKIKLEKDVYGFPQTSIREINILLSFHHPNIVNVSEVVVGSSANSVFMVMEYVDHDLRHILEQEARKKAGQPPFSTAQVKCLMQQLLAGVDYLHQNWVLHRDLKTSNLLYSNDGQLKICDFGLARQYGSPLKPYTPMVVTLWYRSIERLLGEDKYSTALDVWSVGCIMAELLSGKPLFAGKGEVEQVNRIFSTMGTPSDDEWPGWRDLPGLKLIQFKTQQPKLRSLFPKINLSGGPTLSDLGFDLLSRLLALNPAKRISCADALQHPWFKEAPTPTPRQLMPSYALGNANR